MAKPSNRTEKIHADVVHHFAARLRELRVSRGFSQAELAKRARISLPYMGRLERAKGAAGIDLVQRLAKALGVSMAELFPAESPDQFAVLKQQAEKRFNAILMKADNSALAMLNPWLSLLDESLSRKR